MSIQKTSFHVSDNSLTLGMAFSKIDKVNRLVSGFATLDNVDTGDDVVIADASAMAFAQWRGNLREMHQPIAAGHAVNLVQETYYDQQTEKFYDGIYATVYVSLGAEPTWQKVLDGTLTGFSIGGNITDSETQYVPDLGKVVRYIKGYDLVELSLVDNPANQLCNVFSITKSKDGNLVLKGMMAETKTENVFYCRTDEIIKTSTEEKLDCPNCRVGMDLAGWLEKDDSTKTEKLRGVIQKYLAPSDNPQGSPANNEGGVNVAEEKVLEKTEEEEGHVTHEQEIAVDKQGKAETEVAASIDEVESKDETNVDKAADVSEVEDVGDDLVKMFDGLKESISETLQKNADVISGTLVDINGKFETVTQDFESKHSELVTKYTELSTRLAGVETALSSVEKSLGVLDSGTAIRKSNDLGGSEESEAVEQSIPSKWGGHFLGVNSLDEE